MDKCRIQTEILESIKNYEEEYNEGIGKSVLMASLTWYGDITKDEIKNEIRSLMETQKIYESKPKYYKLT